MNELHATQSLDQLTDAELQRLIAEMRGWTDLRWKMRYSYTFDEEGNREELLGCHHEGIIVSELQWVPNWPQDTHAAAVDCLAEMAGYTLGWDIIWEKWSITHDAIVDDRDCEISHFNDHPARAICEDWVMWKRGEK